jgi:hypothetical protein
MFGASVTCMILTDWSVNKNNFTALVRSSDYTTRTERDIQFNLFVYLFYSVLFYFVFYSFLTFFNCNASH